MENTDIVIKTIVDLMEEKDIENIGLYKTEFFGYGGVFPSLEIEIPTKGKVIFGNVDSEEAKRLVEKYIVDTSEIEMFLTDNNGTKKCNH
ncbi:MAG: hypothetical protein KAH04_06065 [Psychrilyobacter sp.]|nr:hypothetical protein [Psychrilyobacter sp.]